MGKKKNEKSISFSKLPKYNENPFIEKAIDDIKVIRKTQVVKPHSRGEIQMIVSEGGEVTGHTAFMRYIEVEEAQFAKVYLSQFSAFWELNNTSIRVFGYIINSLRAKQDMFILYMDKALEYTKYKYAKEINKGIVGLIDAGIIAKAKYDNHYYINPLVVFNGDRVSFAKTYIKKKSGTEKADPNQLDIFEKLPNTLEN